MVGDGRLGEVEQRHQLTDAHLPGVPAQHVDELQADRIAERLRDRRHPNRLATLDIGIHDRLATPLARGALGLRLQLQIDGHQYTYID